MTTAPAAAADPATAGAPLTPAPRRRRQLDNLRVRVGLGILISGLAITGATTWLGAGRMVGQQERQILSQLDASSQWRATLLSQENLRAAAQPMPGERLVWIDAGGMPLSASDGSLQVQVSRGQVQVSDPADGQVYLSRAVELGQVQGRWTDFYGPGSLQGGTQDPGGPVTIGRLMVLRPATPVIMARQQAALSGLAGVLVSALLAGLGAGLLSRQSEQEIEELRADSEYALQHRASSARLPLTGSPELQAIRATFNHMLEELQGAMNRQNSFLSDVSHELRSPITSIHGHARLIMRRHNPAPESHESLTTIIRESERMGRMVSDLLDLQRQEIRDHSGEFDSVVDLGELVARVIAMDPERHNADGARVEITTSGSARVPGEPDRLTQVMINLIDNAVAAGAQHLQVQITHDGPWAVLRLQDDGRGIAPSDLPRVFERFYRADESRQRNRGGSGLGLSIAVMIVRTLHRGEISIDSAGLGQGATVTVKLPLAPEGA